MVVYEVGLQQEEEDGRGTISRDKGFVYQPCPFNEK